MFNTFSFRKLRWSGVYFPCLIHLFWWVPMFPRFSCISQYAFQQSLLQSTGPVGFNIKKNILKMLITSSRSSRWRLQNARLCPANRPNRHLRRRNISCFEGPLYCSFTGNISPWWFHVVSVCPVIYGKKENAPQNDSVQPDFASVNSFNGFSETSGALGFWEIARNLLPSGR